MSNHPKPEVIDYNRLMNANLTRVFNERDAGRRIAAIRELYADDAVLYEPDTSAKGHAAISEAVSALLTHLPPNFVFSAEGPAIGHHNIGRLNGAPVRLRVRQRSPEWMLLILSMGASTRSTCFSNLQPRDPPF
jgi:hypothetical protein